MENILIIKNLYNYVYINPLFYIFGLLSVITGSFIQFVCIFYLIIIHELGHFLIARFFGVNDLKICIYPFGGITKINFNLNIDIYKELLILIMGPLFQIIGFLILIRINYFNSYYDLIKMYHHGILFFNLLPIYPLDGGRILNIFLSLLFSIRKSFFITFFISYLVILILCLLFFSIRVNYIYIFLFLIIKLLMEISKFDYYYEKFLLERYLNNYKFKKRIIINDVKYFYRNRRHLIKIGENYYTEKDFLKKKYKSY